MAVLLFRLRNVPDDEAGDVRHLLTEHDIPFYETGAGNWGISMPGIWLRDAERLDEAKRLLDTYQQQRQRTAREAWEEARARGEKRTVWMLIAEQPLKVALLLAALLAVVYFSVMPFIHLSH